MMKKDNLIVLASRRTPEAEGLRLEQYLEEQYVGGLGVNTSCVEELCDADLLMDIKPLIGKIEDLEVRQALLQCWKEQALKTGFNGLGLA